MVKLLLVFAGKSYKQIKYSQLSFTLKRSKYCRGCLRITSNFYLQIPDDRDHKTVLYREECVGPHFTIWIIVFYTFHSLLLIFGLFLAFETRKISIPALNDSRLIGISVYNVVLLCAVGVPVSFFTNSHLTVSFSLICAVILFCTTLTLGILFVPKVKTSEGVLLKLNIYFLKLRHPKNNTAH